MSSLDTRIREILKLSSLTMQIRCDMIDILTTLRPAARLMVRPGREAETCAEAMVRAGLSVAVARGLKWQPNRRRLGVVDWMGGDNVSGTQMEKFIVFYIALSQAEADASRAADETGDDCRFGKTLGYPTCCVKFVNDRGRVPEHKDVFMLYSARGDYDPLCWPGAMALDQSLLTHYPCTVSCTLSRRMAAFRWRYILDSNCESVIDQVRNAHETSYWLDHDGQVRAGDQVPSDAKAVARPGAALA